MTTTQLSSPGPNDENFNPDQFDDEAAFGRLLSYEEIIESVGNPEPRRFSPAELKELRERSRLLPKPGESAIFHEPNRVNPRMCIYERRSKMTAASVSLSRQRRENWQFIQSVGGTIDLTQHVFWDDNVSAAGGRYRYGMEMCLEQVALGRFDGLVVWEIPRALRNKKEAAKFREILMAAGCDLYVVSMPGVSLWGPGSFLFDALVDQAVKEVEIISLRLRSYHKFMSEVGGARAMPVFGMRTEVSDKRIPGRSKPLKTYVPDFEPCDWLRGRSPGELVLEAVEAVMCGESMGGLARRWNDAGYRTRRGKIFQAPVLKNTLRVPTLAGLAHHGGVLLDFDRNKVLPGTERTAELVQVHQGLLSVSDWLNLQQELDTRTKAAVTRYAGRRTFRDSALNGLLECTACGSVMRSARDTYVCRSSVLVTGSCPGNAMTKRHIEGVVIDAALHVVSDPERRLQAAAANGEDRRELVDEAQSRVKMLAERLDACEDMWLSTTVRDAEAKARFSEKRLLIEHDLTEAKGALSALHVQSSTRLTEVLARAQNVRADWEKLPRHSQNQLLRELIEKVTIRPAFHNTRVDLSRIEIVWKGQS